MAERLAGLQKQMRAMNALTEAMDEGWLPIRREHVTLPEYIEQTAKGALKPCPLRKDYLLTQDKKLIARHLSKEVQRLRKSRGWLGVR